MSHAQEQRLIIGRPFPPGRSGNPGGRKRGIVTLGETIRRKATDPVTAGRIADELLRRAASRSSRDAIQATTLALRTTDPGLFGRDDQAGATAAVVIVQPVLLAGRPLDALAPEEWGAANERYLASLQDASPRAGLPAPGDRTGGGR